MGLAVRRDVSVPATALSHFCKQVSRTYRIDAACGYPANDVDLRQYMDFDSETYFPRIAETVDDLVRDDDLRLCNQDNITRWRQLWSARTAGVDSTQIAETIAVLESQRLLIEYGCAESAFCFCEERKGVCSSILDAADLDVEEDEVDSYAEESLVLTSVSS